MMWFLLASCTLISVLQQVSGVQNCPNSDFTLWKGYCYGFHTNNDKTWSGARTTCQGMSTNTITVDLVSILSDEENTFIYETMKDKTYDDVWIGLKRNPAGDFSWVDGSDSPYTNWASGEPGSSDCAEARRSDSGKWRDYSCTSYYQSYVCKGEADTGWEKKGQWEYFINSGGESKNWYRARDWCNKNGGELASITSDDERDDINDLLTSMGGFTNKLWIGLNRLEGDQRTWTWSDRTPLGSYDNWKDEYPTEDTVFRHHCGVFDSDDSAGEWMNAHCDNLEYGFVCKRDPNDSGMKTIPTPAPGGGFCPSGYIDAGDKCFRLYVRNNENGLTWEQAVSVCRMGAHYRHDIATISNAYEQAVISSAIQKSSLPLWIGLYRSEAGSAEWLWSDNAQFEYTNWGIGEPISSTHLCAGVQPFGIPLGSWGNQDCAKKQGYVCQLFKNPNSLIPTPPLTTPNSCKTDYTPYWKGCYKLYTDMVDWDSANSRCMSDQANLVSIHHGAENGYIQSLANKETKMPLWIGFRDRDGTGEYKWEDGWAVVYTLWGDGEPSRESDTGGCVRLLPGTGTWEDTTCLARNGFVCKTTDEPPVTPPPPSQGTCPTLTEWKEFGSNCYKFHQTSSLSWNDAELRCKEDSIIANLASIHSLQENHWIYKQLTATGFLSSHVWIGMFRRSDTNGFTWTDGSALQFENWAPLEPDGEAKGEDCVAFHQNYHEMWQDQKCYTSQGYVCKAPKVVYPTLPPDGPGYCPPKWVNISAHCYLFEPNLHLSWINAERYCIDQDPSGGSHLVTIKDAAEDIFVVTEMVFREDTIGENDQFWIGLTKKKKGAEYMWIDGDSTAGYKNWDKGEPTGKNDGSTNCAFQFAKNGKWEDEDCDRFKGFSCKMDKLPDPSPSESPTSPPAGQSSTVGQPNTGPSGGAVAGIVIGTLVGVVLLCGVIFFLYKNNINPVTKAKDAVSGFSNPFYSSAEDTKPVADAVDA